MWLLETIEEIDRIANESCICSEDQLTGVDPTVCTVCRAGEMIDELIDIVEGLQKELIGTKKTDIDISDLTRERLKIQIIHFIKDNAGKSISYADLMEEFKIGPRLAVSICKELEREGILK